jgi:hypothetical protein
MVQGDKNNIQHQQLSQKEEMPIDYKRMNNRLSNLQLTVLLVAVGICFLLLALHNPFGGYTEWHTSNNAVFRWIDEPSKLFGFMLPTIVFSLIVVWILGLRNNKG